MVILLVLVTEISTMQTLQQLHYSFVSINKNLNCRLQHWSETTKHIIMQVNSYFFQQLQILSCCFKVCAIGSSLALMLSCKRTMPKLCMDASVQMMNGLEKSGLTRQGRRVNLYLKVLHFSSCYVPQENLASFFVSWKERTHSSCKVCYKSATVTHRHGDWEILNYLNFVLTCVDSTVIKYTSQKCYGIPEKLTFRNFHLNQDLDFPVYGEQLVT